MLKIKKYDEAIAVGKSYKEQDINCTVYRAYRTLKETKNELLDFGDVIWDRDIEGIAAELRKYEIHEFTVSSGYSGIIETLGEFEKHGCKVMGLTTVKTTSVNMITGEPEIKSAIKLSL